jgi:hypothetical protein
VANATDDNGMSSVAFFYGDTLIGSDTSAAGGWEVVWDTTNVQNGQYSLSAVATDTATQSTTSLFVAVSVSNGSSGGTTFSLSLTGSPSGKGSIWTSTVTITATGPSGAPLSGVVVSGTWSSGGTASCTTDGSGSCPVSRSQQKRVGSVTYTVSGATHVTLTWDAGPDSVTVLKP